MLQNNSILLTFAKQRHHTKAVYLLHVDLATPPICIKSPDFIVPDYRLPFSYYCAHTHYGILQILKYCIILLCIEQQSTTREGGVR